MGDHDRAYLDTPPTLFAQIAELQRERHVRDNVYPRLVALRKLSAPKADYQNRCLDAAIRTLQGLREKQGDS